MCQVYTATFVAILAPEKTDYTACHPENTTTMYILHVVPITKHTHVRRKSIGEKKRKQNTEKEGKRYSDWPNKRMESGFSEFFFGAL